MPAAAISTDNAGRVVEYDPKNLTEVRFLKAGAWVESVAFSPDGKLLASASDDWTAKAWDAASTRALLAGIGQHRAKVVILDVTGGSRRDRSVEQVPGLGRVLS